MTLATTQQDAAAVMEQVMLAGDLSKLSPQQRVSYYMRVCESLGLNPATKPFDYISLQGKLTLYARRDAADQLRKRDNISILITGRERLDDVYVVTARATTPDGRTDEAIGAVPLGGLKGEMLANAFMKAETKSKRRVTLSICGLGFSDESEIDAIPDARRVRVDDQGEILNVTPAPAAKPAPAATQAAPQPKPQPAPQQQPAPQPSNSNGSGSGAASVTMRFGKYAGKSLGEIAATDLGYIKWLADNAQQTDVREAAKAIIAATPQAQPTQQGPTQQQIARLMAIAHEGNIAKETIQAYMQQHYGIDSLKQLTRAQYDEVCEWLQAGGLDDEDVPPEAYDEQQETFGDQAQMQW